MPKGDKARKNHVQEKKIRDMPYKDDENTYALVSKKLGGARFSVILYLTAREAIAKLRGKFKKGYEKKSNIVNIGSIVLVSIRDYQDGMVDIVHVYNEAEVAKLRKSGVITEDSFGKNTGDFIIGPVIDGDIGCDFAFEEI